MSLIANGAGESAKNFYNGVIAQSLRFGTNNYLTNELDAPSDDQNFTISTWFKRSKLGAEEGLWAVDATGSYCRFEASGAIRVRQYNGIINAITTAFFRDTSAWYHLVVAWDMDNSTAADRIIIYVNGVRQTLATYHAPTTSETSNLNADGRTLHIGTSLANGDGNFFEGYMADFNFVDGSVLAPTEFAETKNGVWIPIEPDGLTYGNNGFRLQFANSAVSSASSSTIGADTSGKARHFTSAGILASDCAMPDTPENNFPTMGSFQFRRAYRSQDNALSEGALKVAPPSTYNSIILASMRINEVLSNGSGAYWEVRVDSGGAGNNSYSGVVGGQESSNLASATGPNTWPIAAVFDYLRGYFYVNTTSGDYSSIVTYAEDDIIGFAIKSDGKFFMHKNGTYFNQLASGAAQNPVNGANPLATLDLTNDYFPFADGQPGVHYNFGQDSTFAGAISAGGETDANGIGDFAYEVPTGFLALCSANMSEPTIGPNSTTVATDHFNTVLYTGNASGQTITGVGFQPDLSWNKNRATTDFHLLQDSTRGAGKELFSNSSADEESYSTSITSWNSDGFVLGDREPINANNEAYVSWNWKANGGTTTTNDASSTSVGTIDSVFQANTTAGFSIVTFAADNTAGRVVAHGLGVAPKMIITKGIAQATGWYTYHFNIGANKFIRLNEANPEATNTGIWGNTHPTSSVFTIGNNECGYNNGGANDVLAYCFAEVDGYSKMGSYVGNVDAEGVYVYLGFRPAWILLKRTTGGSTYNWFIHDNKRGAFNVNDERLTSDTNEAESTSITSMDFLSSGFKIRTANTSYNEGNFIYMAFAAQPFKYANGG